jgi:hypothetical protein
MYLLFLRISYVQGTDPAQCLDSFQEVPLNDLLDAGSCMEPAELAVEATINVEIPSQGLQLLVPLNIPGNRDDSVDTAGSSSAGYSEETCVVGKAVS